MIILFNHQVGRRGDRNRVEETSERDEKVEGWHPKICAWMYLISFVISYWIKTLLFIYKKLQHYAYIVGGMGRNEIISRTNQP